MSEPFKPGDVVRLNSGGPIMTVQELRAPEDVICVWFDKTKQCHGVFNAAMLHIHRPAPMSFSVSRA
jgi:uncharacterized protein YodC (DUF2158 family)